MEQTLTRTDEASDADLISAVRAGDLDAYGVLFGRHREAARRMARQVAPACDVDDLVAESFSRVLARLQDGGGPDEAFRAYLLTAIRRLHIDRVRASNKVWATAHEAELDRAVEFVDPAEMTFEHGAAAMAFASLPERWRLVLWHLDIEGQKPADVAPLLGLTANGVSALAYRAREGLRQAYLQGHLAPSLDESCRTTIGMLGSYVRRGLSARDTAKVDAHLDGCSRCTGLALELSEVNANLSGVLGPSLLGPAFAGYVAAGAGLAALGAGAAAVAGAKLVAGGAAKLAVVPAKVIGAAAAGAGTQGVVAAAVVTGVATVGTVAIATDVVKDPRSSSTNVVAPATAGLPTGRTTSGAPAEPAVATSQDAPATALPTEVVPSDAAPSPSSSPTPDPTVDPTPEPTDEATDEPTAEPSDDPSPEPGASPAPTEAPVVPTDYGVGATTVTNDDLLLLRRFTVPVTATVGGRSAPQAVTVTMTFTRAVQLDRVVSPGWDCDAMAPGRPISTLACTTTPGAGQGTTFVVTARGARPAGTVTVSSPGDPDPSNDSGTFEAAPLLLLL